MPTPIIFAPGFINLQDKERIELGRRVRDSYIWEYPILPGAVQTYQQMASNREWKVAGAPRKVSRVYEWLSEARTYDYYGLAHHGLNQFLRRRVLDYLAVGRTSFGAKKTGFLEYLDPIYLRFEKGVTVDSNKWFYPITDATYRPSEIYVDHAIPIGAAGNFIAPLMFVVPTAMLAWLIREHDRAATDGRKVRDVLLVNGQETAIAIKQAIEQMIELWSGADPTTNSVPVVHVDLPSTSQITMQDTVAKLNISEIPPSFDRQLFQFEYVNEIAAALGISLRHFWNSERATNRALEEVQEARQLQKGPSAFVRTEQHLLNRAISEVFGDNVKMAFDEEVDVQSRETNARVLKLYTEALEKITGVFGANINGDALLAWLQADGILPSDLSLIEEIDLGDQRETSSIPTPVDGNVQQTSNDTTPNLEKSLTYGDVVIDSSGQIVTKRQKVFRFENVLEQTIANEIEPELPSLEDLLEPITNAEQRSVPGASSSTDGTGWKHPSHD